MLYVLVTGVVFWACLFAVGLIIAGLLSLDDDNPHTLAIFVFTGALLATILFTDVFLGVQILYAIPIILAYVGLGVIWSVKKWRELVIAKRDTLKTAYEGIPDGQKQRPGYETWEVYRKDKQPLAKDNKQRITTWMALWPFSFTWWVLTWPRHAFNWCYKYLVTTFDRMSEKIMAG